MGSTVFEWILLQPPVLRFWCTVVTRGDPLAGGANARDLSATRDLTSPEVHTNPTPFRSHRARPHD